MTPGHDLVCLTSKSVAVQLSRYEVMTNSYSERILTCHGIMLLFSWISISNKVVMFEING